MYHQKLQDGIKARTGQEEETNRTRITLCPFTSIYSSEIVPATGATTGEVVHLTLHGILTRSISHKTYDVVFCGTGYDRDAWMRLLAESDLAEHYGVKSSAIELVPETEPASASAPASAGEQHVASVDLRLVALDAVATLEARRSQRPFNKDA